MTAILCSIHSDWARLIFEREKTCELQRTAPRRHVDRMLVYDTGVHLIVGEARVEGVLAGLPEDVWLDCAADRSCVSRLQYERYYRDARRAVAFLLSNARRYPTPLSLTDVGVKRPPRSWMYLTGV